MTGHRTKFTAALISALALAAALAVVAPTALAGKSDDSAPPPEPTDPTIVVAPNSLGGVSVGQSSADAEAAWGNTGECTSGSAGGSSTRSCRYGSPTKGSADLLALGDQVQAVGIMAPLGKHGFRFKGPMMKFRTTEGLGLGSKLSKVAKAYPDGKEKGRGFVVTDGESRMNFFASRGPKARVTQVILTDAHL